MKKLIWLTAIVAIFLSLNIANAKDKKVPSVKIKTLKKEVFNTNKFNNDGKPIVISFWATWCKPCLTELSAINEVYEDWQDETGVKVIAVSIDDSRNSRRVPSFVKGRGWEFEVYLDENSDFKRAMGVNNPPHTFLIDGKGNIVWEHNGYSPGDEEELFEEIQKLSK